MEVNYTILGQLKVVLSELEYIKDVKTSGTLRRIINGRLELFDLFGTGFKPSEPPGLTLDNDPEIAWDFPEDQKKAMIKAIKWGINNPEYNFASLRPRRPRTRHSNEDIYAYLCILETALPYPERPLRQQGDSI